MGDGAGGPPVEPPELFFVVDDDETRDEAGHALAALDSRDDALDAHRVRQLSALRRNAYRTRSYWLVAVGVCAAAGLQVAVLTVRHVHAAGWQLRPIGYVCGIVAAAMAARFFARKAAELTRELSQRPAGPDEAHDPPDFSTLSDGSQSWKNLEQMHNRG